MVGVADNVWPLSAAAWRAWRPHRSCAAMALPSSCSSSGANSAVGPVRSSIRRPASLSTIASTWRWAAAPTFTTSAAARTSPACCADTAGCTFSIATAAAAIFLVGRYCPRRSIWPCRCCDSATFLSSTDSAQCGPCANWPVRRMTTRPMGPPSDGGFATGDRAKRQSGDSGRSSSSVPSANRSTMPHSRRLERCSSTVFCPTPRRTT